LQQILAKNLHVFLPRDCSRDEIKIHEKNQVSEAMCPEGGGLLRQGQPVEEAKDLGFQGHRVTHLLIENVESV
jgi:hypothetical protein